MCNPHVSIIVPVYNSEKYAIECYESIRTQDYIDFEVILVNDGSTDDSKRMAEDYIAEHKLQNWYLINKVNGGPSSARNMGLEKAKGKWIAFVDSDDWIDTDYLSKMVTAVEEKSADICMIGIIAELMDCSVQEKWCDYRQEYGRLPENLDALESFGFVHSRLYKREVLEEQNIRFDERILYCEDTAFNYDYNRCINSFVCIQEYKYHYRYNREGSLTASSVHPSMKYHLYEHMKRFLEAYSSENLKKGIQKNIDLQRTMWGTAYTAVTNDILEGKYANARRKIKNDLIREVLKVYTARSRKDKMFIFLWKRSFLGMVFLVKLYYGNFSKIHGSRLFKLLSK